MCSHVCPQGLNIRMLMGQIQDHFGSRKKKTPRDVLREKKAK
jgi:hypothetical protein